MRPRAIEICGARSIAHTDGGHAGKEALPDHTRSRHLEQGLTSPLFYELAAELIYPVKEGMSAGILVRLPDSILL